MNRHFFGLAFLAGACALLWVASGFFAGHALALSVTLLIAAVYGVGAVELHGYRQATASLATALQNIPQPLHDLNDWLPRLHPALHNPVRLRIEGERSALPGPTLTPYLVGLLVMLGMLGTFLGMVATLNGAVFALEGSSDVAAIRNAFAVPIKGLGLAFGTSVAGVASSAMLGLMSAMARRERLHAAHILEGKIATVLRPFSLTHQRQQAYLALQQQAHALPAVMQQMQTLMARMEQTGEQVAERLLANQQGFHTSAQAAFTTLAQAVDQSLRNSLGHSAQLAGESIKPLVESTMAGLAQHGRDMHQRMVSSTEEWGRARIASEAQWSAQQGQSMGQLTRVLKEELATLRSAESERGLAVLERLEGLQGAVAQHLTTLGQGLEDPIKRLIETASEAPRAAAEVIGTLRQQISSSMERDNALLQERSRILETLHALLASIDHASSEQRGVIDGLVASSAVALHEAGGRFEQKMDSEAGRLAEVAAQVTGSAIEVSSLGQAFGFAVGHFNEGNEKLMAHLQRVEAAMDKSIARSDDQLAYYVAQAREVIDLSVMAQKEMVDALRQLKQPTAVAEAA
jgi:hypothetical protein